MDEEVEEISFEIIPAFTGFGKRPIYKCKSFRVTAPSNYTFSQVMNELGSSGKVIKVDRPVRITSIRGKGSVRPATRRALKDVCISDSSGVYDVKKIGTEFRMKSKLSKRGIRTKLEKNNHVFSPQKRINQVGITDGDTVHLVLPGNPVTPPRPKPRKRKSSKKE